MIHCPSLSRAEKRCIYSILLYYIQCMHNYEATVTIPKIRSTYVKMNSISGELHTPQKVSYLTYVKILCINIAHKNKTLVKSQTIYWLYTKTRYVLLEPCYPLRVTLLRYLHDTYEHCDHKISICDIVLHAHQYERIYPCDQNCERRQAQQSLTPFH